MKHRRRKKSSTVQFKKTLYFLIVIFVFSLGYIIFSFKKSGTEFTAPSKFILVSKSENLASILKKIKEDSISLPGISVKMADFYYTRFRGKDVYPGKYQIKKGMSVMEILQSFYRGNQYTIKLVINKFRLWGDFIAYLQSEIPIDSAEFTERLRELAGDEKVGRPEELFSYIIPDTYHCYWTSSSDYIAEKLYNNYSKFWNEDRIKQASTKKLTTTQIYVIASLVEEETNNNEQKKLIASVFINRLRKRMYLGSCPSIKYSLQDFSLRRILYKHLNVKSPFNTYRNLGLPPAPICTPSTVTIDAVLSSPDTDYLYFVADSEIPDAHIFSKRFEDHTKMAKIYVKKVYDSKREKNDSTEVTSTVIGHHPMR